MFDTITYILAKKYVDDTLSGSGALQGKSAYEIAVENGFTGTETEWLESLNGTSPHNGTTFGYNNTSGVQTEQDPGYPEIQINSSSKYVEVGGRTLPLTITFTYFRFKIN